MFKFVQAEGYGKLISQDCETVDELDCMARIVSDQLKADGASMTCYYKCDLYKDGKRVDRFDLKPSMGSGVDDLGRKPSEMLRAHNLI